MCAGVASLAVFAAAKSLPVLLRHRPSLRARELPRHVPPTMAGMSSGEGREGEGGRVAPKGHLRPCAARRAANMGRRDRTAASGVRPPPAAGPTGRPWIPLRLPEGEPTPRTPSHVRRPRREDPGVRAPHRDTLAVRTSVFIFSGSINEKEDVYFFLRGCHPSHEEQASCWAGS